MANRYESQRRRTAFWNVITHILMLAGSVLMVAPFVWMFSTSLKTEGNIFTPTPEWLPRQTFYFYQPAGGAKVKIEQPLVDNDHGRSQIRLPGAADLQWAPASSVVRETRLAPAWENYTEVIRSVPFFQGVRNTLFITLTALIGGLFTTSLSAYAFAKLRFPGRDTLFFALLGTMMIPGVVTMLPTFILFRQAGWINTFYPLIIPALFGGAWGIFLMRQHFKTIPDELEDAARIDGCNPFMTYSRVVMPLSRPTLATLAIFGFMGGWNDFMGPLIYLNDPDKFTLQLLLASFSSYYSTKTNLLMAGSVMSLIPVLILFFAAQRYFVQGITLTGMKG
ncbi:MAG TPA: carbohydrate ABC transporter permease [Armatimonadota bacterium]